MSVVASKVILFEPQGSKGADRSCFVCFELYRGYPGEVGICSPQGKDMKGQCICKAARWMSIQSFPSSVWLLSLTLI